MFDLVKKFTEVPGPLGFEGDVAGLFRSELAALGFETHRTPIGNMIAHLGGRGPRLVIDAHLDEISLLVKSVTGDGFLMVTHGTGNGESTVPFSMAYYLREVLVKGKTRWTPGYIGAATGHVRTARQRSKTEVEWNDVFVDLGLSSKEEIEALGIRPGCPIIFDRTTRRLGNLIQPFRPDTRTQRTKRAHWATWRQW